MYFIGIQHYHSEAYISRASATSCTPLNTALSRHAHTILHNPTYQSNRVHD